MRHINKPKQTHANNFEQINKNKPKWNQIYGEQWEKIYTKANGLRSSGMNNYKKFGEKFITNFKPFFIYDEGKRKFLIDFAETEFEASHGLAVKIPKKELTEEERLNLRKSSHWIDKQDFIFIIKLGFEQHAVVVEAIQGRKGFSGKIKEFEKTVGMPIANYLITELEKQAKKEGYNFVKITKPEELEFYKRPFHPELDAETDSAQWEKWTAQIRKNMKKLYYNVAKNLKYVKGKEKGFFVKKL